MARPLAEYFGEVWPSDVHDYGVGYHVSDFLFANTGPMCPCRPDWVITNPPFRLAQAFIGRAARVAIEGSAMLVRTAFLEGIDRFETLFRDAPPTHVLQFAERVPMHKGKLTATGSTATAYCWLVWVAGAEGTSLGWIPPSRRRLERPEDYWNASW